MYNCFCIEAAEDNEQTLTFAASIVLVKIKKYTGGKDEKTHSMDSGIAFDG